VRGMANCLGRRSVRAFGGCDTIEDTIRRGKERVRKRGRKLIQIRPN